MKTTKRPLFFRLHSLLAAAALSSLAQAATIETINFTAAEGYVDGTLNGQNGWTEATPWIVNSTLGTATHSTSGDGGFSKAQVDGGVAMNLGIGDSATIRTVIQLGGPLMSGAISGKQIMQFGIGSATNADGIGLEGYSAQLYVSGTNLALIDQGFGNAATLSLADNANDRLAIDMTYTRTGEAESSISWQMFNLDKPANVSNIGTIAGLGANHTALMTTLDPVPTFTTAHYFTANNGVESITMFSTQVVVIPEPSAALLGGLGLLALLRRRR